MATRPGVTTERLVGRRDERARLDDALRTLDRGVASIIEVIGEPGIGKTTVMSVLAAAAEQRGAPVLDGRAAEYERDLPFGVMVDALDRHLARSSLCVKLGVDSRVEAARAFERERSP